MKLLKTYRNTKGISMNKNSVSEIIDEGFRELENDSEWMKLKNDSIKNKIAYNRGFGKGLEYAQKFIMPGENNA